MVLPFLKLPKTTKKSGREISSCNGATHCDSDRKQPPTVPTARPRVSHREPPGVLIQALLAALTESLPRFEQRVSLRPQQSSPAVLTESLPAAPTELPRDSDRDPTNARVRVLTVICRFGAHGQHCRSLVDGRWCAMYLNTDTGARPSCTAG